MHFLIILIISYSVSLILADLLTGSYLLTVSKELIFLMFSMQSPMSCFLLECRTNFYYVKNLLIATNNLTEPFEEFT